MLLAVAFLVAAGVAAVTAAKRTATRERATMLRLFIWKPPESGGPVAHNETRRRAVGTDHLPLRRMLSQCSPCCQYQSWNWSYPAAETAQRSAAAGAIATGE